MLHSDIKIIAAKQSHHKADFSGTADFPVYGFIFNQPPDLTVKHPVELCRQNYIIAIVPVLGEKRKPTLPTYVLPFPGIEEQLCFIDEQQKLPFL